MAIENADLAEVSGFLDRRFGLDTLWLFGSEAASNARPDSDVDFAALFSTRPPPLEVLEAQADLTDLLKREIDLVDLEPASPILGMQVLKKGRVIFERDPKHRHAFFVRTMSMYEDLSIIRREAENALFRRMSVGRS
ncbi:MAG TPA: nucleotidyltransferase domain-containing protein [Thermoanaerobaculia bacterium]|nr:nucleotidyltransferase domain-containing protein [Thermoanaerobaculia bacterium]